MVPNRFVILHHLAPTGEHWDLMLEQPDCLFTWRMSAEPVDRDACPIECLRINEHRKRYLEHEGPISGGRGIVSRVDQGTYQCLSADENGWILNLQGRRLRGDFSLLRSDPASQSRWTFIAT